jgi:ceramide glucosyltransferase
MHTIFFVTTVILSGTGGEICVTYAMKRVGEVHDFSPRTLLSMVTRAFRVAWMWLGILLMALSFYAFLALLSWNPVSFVIPVLALSHAVGALGAKFLLREQVSGTRWTGVSLVCGGVALVWAGKLGGHLSNAATPPALRSVVLTLACAPLVYYLLSIFSARRFFSRKRSEAARARETPEFAPPVSILKPVRGLDPKAYENYATFCRLDYPQYEVLFCVSEPDDPAIPVIESLIRDFPEQPISLFVGTEHWGANEKVNKLCRLAREAQYELLVISDSDIRVGPDYLRAVVAPFRDPKVGAVTCMYSGLAEHQLGAELEAVGAASDFFAGVLIARSLQGMNFAMGSTMATTRRRLAEIGGFESLADQHSDDFELGRRIAARGWKVDLSGYVVCTMYPARTARSYFEHQLRWARTTRECRPWGYLGMVLTHGLPWSFAAALLTSSRTAAGAYVGGYVALRFLMAWTVGVWGLRDAVLRRKLWLVPVRDALAFLVWGASFFSRRIHWRGLEFMVVNGRMVAVTPRVMAASTADSSVNESV